MVNTFCGHLDFCAKFGCEFAYRTNLSVIYFLSGIHFVVISSTHQKVLLSIKTHKQQENTDVFPTCSWLCWLREVCAAVGLREVTLQDLSNCNCFPNQVVFLWCQIVTSRAKHNLKPNLKKHRLETNFYQGFAENCKHLFWRLGCTSAFEPFLSQFNACLRTNETFFSHSSPAN